MDVISGLELRLLHLDSGIIVSSHKYKSGLFVLDLFFAANSMFIIFCFRMNGTARKTVSSIRTALRIHLQFSFKYVVATIELTL